jgi:Zn-dependent peptidase ImmA (M78 family)/DNA-binding XRE family transcriptional regulator
MAECPHSYSGVSTPKRQFSTTHRFGVFVISIADSCVAVYIFGKVFDLIMGGYPVALYKKPCYVIDNSVIKMSSSTSSKDSSSGIGESFRLLRKTVRVSQTCIAEYADISRPSIIAIERGTREPRRNEILKFSSLLRIRPELLITGQYERVVRDLPKVNYRADGKEQDFLDQVELSEAESLQKEGKIVALPSILQKKTIPYAVQQVYNWKEVSSDKPVDIFRWLYDIENLHVVFTALTSLCGAVSLNQGRAVVLINSDQPDERLHWTAAHEFAHLILGHAADERPHRDVYGIPRPEDQDADRFAAELLMPVGAVVKKLAEESDKTDQMEDVVYQLARHFHVSYLAMLYRLSNLQVINWEMAERLRAIKPSIIEKRLKIQKSGTPFDSKKYLPKLVKKLEMEQRFPSGWQVDFDKTAPHHLRLLQAEAYKAYVCEVSLVDRLTSVNKVYEDVAQWVADTYSYI